MTGSMRITRDGLCVISAIKEKQFNPCRIS